MASPQIENGYTRTANELQEALCKLNMSAYESRVFRAIERLTYGYSKTKDSVSIRQLSKLTDLDFRHAHRALTSLARRKLIDMKTEPGKVSIIGIQKDYEKWDQPTDASIGDTSIGDISDGDTSTDDATDAYTGIGTDACIDDNQRKKEKKENIIPEEILSSGASRSEVAIKTPKGDKWGTDEDLHLAREIYENVLVISSTQKEPNWASWVNDIRLMRERDGRAHSEILALFLWANQHHFWDTNILSPKKLRDKWETLIAQKRKGGEREGSRNDGECWAGAI